MTTWARPANWAWIFKSTKAGMPCGDAGYFRHKAHEAGIGDRNSEFATRSDFQRIQRGRGPRHHSAVLRKERLPQCGVSMVFQRGGGAFHHEPAIPDSRRR